MHAAAIAIQSVSILQETGQTLIDVDVKALFMD